MAINETISTGNKYRRLKDATNKVWQRLSFWTKASDVEFDNGTTAQASLGNITGITDSVNSNSSTVAASANAVYTLNSNLANSNNRIGSLESANNARYVENGRINIYVGSDSRLHFVNRDGADTVLNFSRTYVDVESAVCDAGIGASLYAPNNGNVSKYHLTNTYSASFTIAKKLDKGYLSSLSYTVDNYHTEQYSGSSGASISFTLVDGSATVSTGSYDSGSSKDTHSIDFGTNYKNATDGSLTLSFSGQADADRGTHQYGGGQASVGLKFTAIYKTPKYST